MNYKHLDEKKKAQIDILYGLKYSMREIGKKLNISHSTVSRYLNTVDNGLEFQALGITAKRLGVKLYKYDPCCSFQRGTNERANALVRRFIPKGKSMYQISQQYLEDISFQINSMKRKLFDFKSSFDVEYEHIVNGAL